LKENEVFRDKIKTKAEVIFINKETNKETGLRNLKNFERGLL